MSEGISVHWRMVANAGALPIAVCGQWVSFQAHADRVQPVGANPAKTRHIHRMAKRPEITRKELLHGARKAVDSLKKRLMDRIAETMRRGRAARQKDRHAR